MSHFIKGFTEVFKMPFDIKKEVALEMLGGLAATILITFVFVFVVYKISVYISDKGGKP